MIRVVIKMRKVLLIGFFIGLLIIIIFSNHNSLELKLSDRLQGGIVPYKGITIINIDDNSIKSLGKFPWSREVYAKVINNINAKVIGFDIGFFDRGNDEEIIKAINKAQKKNITIVMAEEIINNKVLKPIYNVSSGYSNLFLDSDGILRYVPFNLKGDAFSYKIASSITQISYPKESIIRFVGPSNSFDSVSFLDVYNGKKINNDIVLIGTNSSHDEYNVPTDTLMSGVEIHANIIQMLLQHSFIFNCSKIIKWLIILLSSIIGSLIVYFSLPSKSWLMISSLLLIPIYFLIVILNFNKGLLLPIMTPITSFLCGGLSSGIWWSYSEQNKKRIIKKAFEKYVSKDIVKEIIKNPDKLNLGGEKREISILFSDIRGFTSLSEKTNSEKLVSFLNNYFSLMTKIVLDNKGFLDKFIGDAIMALWNTPIDQKNHAQLACETALKMKFVLEKKSVKGLFKNLKIGIGINTGEAVVGNLGSEKRFDYTAIGDNVNLASRLEGLTKSYGVNIIISEYTKKNVKVSTRLLDKVQVKGKKKPVKIYELLEEKNSIHKTYEKALELYFKGRFHEAKKIFFKNKNDVPSNIMIKRCDEFIKKKPKYWNGIWEHKSK